MSLRYFEDVRTCCSVSHYLSGDQHGFISGRSTTTNLLCLMSHITEGFVKATHTDVIYTELSAAFDKLDHSIAVAKLGRLGISGNFLRWFESYLVNRRFTVAVEGFCSKEFFAPLRNSSRKLSGTTA